MNNRSSSLIRWVYPSDYGTVSEEGGASVVPELFMLGYQRYTEAYPLQLHSHDQAYEFVFLESGNVNWEIDEAYYPVSAGQWFYTKPGEPHRARFNYLEPSRIWWFILMDPMADPDWFGMDAAYREYIHIRLKELPRVFNANHRVRELFLRLKSTLEMDHANKGLFARYQILDILLGLLQPVSTKSIEPELRESVIRSVNQWVLSPEKRYSIAEMAQAVRVSESHYYKLFHQLFGQSPSAYMERVRIERACVLLKDDLSITEIAFELGFKTSQHFSTVFHKLVGISPSQWRKQMKV
jgi:AraC-like DNA-binding protein